MKSGEAYAHIIMWQTSAGAAATGKVLADLTYSFALDGVSTSITPTLTELDTVGSWRRYRFAFTAPTSTGLLEWTLYSTTASDVLDRAGGVEAVTAYDLDEIAATIATASSLPSTDVATNTSLTIYDGDSIRVDLSVLDAALTKLGAASLAAIDTLTAGIKLTSKNSDDTQDATGTVSIVTDSVGARVIRVVLNTFPAALAVPDASQSVSARIDVRATEGSITLIIASCDLTVLWKATTA